MSTLDLIGQILHVKLGFDSDGIRVDTAFSAFYLLLRKKKVLIFNNKTYRIQRSHIYMVLYLWKGQSLFSDIFKGGSRNTDGHTLTLTQTVLCRRSQSTTCLSEISYSSRRGSGRQRGTTPGTQEVGPPTARGWDE